MCQKIESITLPNTLTYLGSEAFANCTGLKEVILDTGKEELLLENLMHCGKTRKIFLQ